MNIYTKKKKKILLIIITFLFVLGHSPVSYFIKHTTPVVQLNDHCSRIRPAKAARIRDGIQSDGSFKLLIQIETGIMDLRLFQVWI